MESLGTKGELGHCDAEKVRDAEYMKVDLETLG